MYISYSNLKNLFKNVLDKYIKIEKAIQKYIKTLINNIRSITTKYFMVPYKVIIVIHEETNVNDISDNHLNDFKKTVFETIPRSHTVNDLHKITRVENRRIKILIVYLKRV